MYQSDRNESYDEMLNEVFGPVVLGTFTFDPADIFFELDNIGYRIGLSAWEGEQDDEEDDEEEDEYADEEMY